MFLIRFLRALFGIYALLVVAALVVICSLLVIMMLLFSSRANTPHKAHKVARFWSKCISFFCLVPMRVQNREYIDPGKVYVFVANHQSQLDIPAYAISCTNTFRFLAKAELTKIPLMGWVIRKLYLTVNRADRADRNRSIEVMKKSLDEGVSVFLCPEGTRNRKKDPPLLDFRDGAFRLAIHAQVPIAPLTVLNTGDKLSPNRPIEFTPGAIYAAWDKPIETKGMTQDDLPALKEKVRAQMIARLKEFRKA